MLFEQFNLHSTINKALSACGYANPTPIQVKSIPAILMGNDLVASAQTGTGKTAAFILPALHRLGAEQTKPRKKPRILILTPTRELANQITQSAHTYGKFMRVKIVSLVGGMRYQNQINDLARGADIIVATPGRLLDHMEQNRVDLSEIEMLILDEADRMLDMGFIDDVKDIAEHTPDSRQTLLFSATLDDKLMRVIRHLLKQPVRIDLSNEKIAAPKITQEWYKAKNTHHKSHLLRHFLNDRNIYKAIVFSATKINADKLAMHLRDQGFAAAALHGGLKQNVRNRTLDQLRHGKIQILVATDVAARGIDVNDITHVFNYDLPKFCEDYVHRIGRTGRAGKSGIAISFVLPDDIRHLQRIERYIGQRLTLIPLVQLDEETSITANPLYSPEGKESKKRSFSADTANYRHNKKEYKPKRKSFSKDDTNRYHSELSSYRKENKRKSFSKDDANNTRSLRDPYKKENKISRYASDHTSSSTIDYRKPNPAKKNDAARKKEWRNHPKKKDQSNGPITRDFAKGRDKDRGFSKSNNHRPFKKRSEKANSG